MGRNLAKRDRPLRAAPRLLGGSPSAVTANVAAFPTSEIRVFLPCRRRAAQQASTSEYPARGSMGRLLVSLTLFGLIAGTSSALARGGPLHLFESQRQPVVRAGAPTLSLPPPGEFLTGCGRGRYRDQATQKCRGPADVGR